MNSNQHVTIEGLMNLPFSSLSIEAGLFQTEIMIGLLGIMFFGIYLGYLSIRYTEKDIQITGVKKNEEIQEKNIGEILDELEILISNDNSLNEISSGKWHEKLLFSLEKCFNTTILRNEAQFYNTHSLPEVWKKLLVDILHVRYNPKCTEIEKKTIKKQLLDEISTLRKMQI